MPYMFCPFKVAKADEIQRQKGVPEADLKRLQNSTVTWPWVKLDPLKLLDWRCYVSWGWKKETIVSQPPIFRGYVGFRGGTPGKKHEKLKRRHQFAQVAHYPSAEYVPNRVTAGRRVG